MPGLSEHDDIERSVRQSRVLGDTAVPRHAGNRRGLGAHRLRGFHRVHDGTRARQELTHLAGASTDVGDAQRRGRGGDGGEGRGSRDDGSVLDGGRIGRIARGRIDNTRPPTAQPSGRQERGHGLVGVGGAHGGVRTPLPHEGIRLQRSGRCVRYCHRVLVLTRT